MIITKSFKVKNKKLKKNGLTTPCETLLLCVLALSAFLMYCNTLQGGFVLDDWYLIRDNPAVRMQELTWDNLMKAMSSAKFRPAAMATFALNHHFQGYALPGYHIVNILIHIAAGILLYFFIKTTVNLPAIKSQYGKYAYLCPLWQQCCGLSIPFTPNR